MTKLDLLATWAQFRSPELFLEKFRCLAMKCKFYEKLKKILNTFANSILTSLVKFNFQATASLASLESLASLVRVGYIILCIKCVLLYFK